MKSIKKLNSRFFFFILIGGFILQSSKCKDTTEPTPVAVITSSSQSIMAYESITFTDASISTAASREWVIDGGTPSSSTAASVTAQFTKEGAYSVKLTIKNTSGVSNSATVSVVVKPATFVHTVSASNIVSNWTVLDNPATNNNPSAILIVTQNWGSSGVYHNKAIGVWYSGGKWNIFNQNSTAMSASAGTKFNVLVKQPSDKAFVVTASSISGHVGNLSNAALNGNANAKLLITQNYGVSSVYNNNPIGLWYNGNWTVYNQNNAAMPTNAQFNVVVDDKISIVTASAPSGNSYLFSLPSTDNQPDALVFASQYWTSVYNTSEIGLWYTGGKWAVFNQNLAAMPTNAKFMVLSNKQF